MDSIFDRMLTIIKLHAGWRQPLYLIFPKASALDFMVSVNRYTAVLVVFGLLMQINCVFAYYGLFFLNQKAIAESVCEKRTKDCCGHCFLQKKIDSTQDTQSSASDKPTSTRSLNEMLDLMHGLQPEDQKLHSLLSTVNRFACDAATFLPPGDIRQIDHPPKPRFRIIS